MNIVIAYLVSLSTSLIGNTLLLINVIKDINKRKLKIEFDFKIKKIKNFIIKESIFLLIPIINLINTLYLMVNYLANQNIAIEMLNDFGILQKPDNDLESKVTHHTDSIKLNKYRNKKFVKQENDLNDNLVENIEEDYLEYYDEVVELDNSEEPMKLIRKKKE